MANIYKITWTTMRTQQAEIIASSEAEAIAKLRRDIESVGTSDFDIEDEWMSDIDAEDSGEADEFEADLFG